MKLRKSKEETQRKVPRNLALSYYKRLALFLGLWIPLSLIGIVLSLLVNESDRGGMFWVPWFAGFSWLGYALYVFIWAFIKVNSLVVMVIARNLGQAAIVRKIVFTQFFAIAGLILGVTSFVSLFLGITGWNLSPLFALLTIVSQVLSFNHVPLLSQLLSEDKTVVLEGVIPNSKESQLNKVN